jgi:hypothetical protein
MLSSKTVQDIIHLGHLCLLTLDLHLVSKIMECTVVFFIVIKGTTATNKIDGKAV